jgi:hypothetical protein
MSYEVSEPIQNSPFEKPARYGYIQEGEEPDLRTGRRPPVVFPPRDQKEEWTESALLRRSKEYPAGYELALVNLIRERLEAWRQGYAGVTRTTLELPHSPVRNRDRKAPLIRPESRPGSEAPPPRNRERIGTRRRQGRATDRRGQHPNPRLKKNSRNRITCRDPHPLPDRSPSPPRNANDRYSA